jgi:small subunit ribosomal protein S20
MAEEKKAGGAAPAEKKKKARITSAQKRDKQSLKARLRNRSFKATVTTAIRSFEDAVSKGDKTVMKQRLDALYSLMDKGVKTGRYKLNKAARTKSRLAAKVA